MTDEGAADAEMVEAVEAAAEATGDFFDHEPSKEEKIDMRQSNKTPSEWLRLLCRDWAAENEVLVAATDERFLAYKSYLKGSLTPQLLCRLSIPPTKDNGVADDTSNHPDFWRILGIEDDFDKSYIIAQVERFCAFYNIRGPSEEVEGIYDQFGSPEGASAVAAAAGISVSPNGGITLPSYMTTGLDPSTAAAVSAAAAAVAADVTQGKLSKKQAAEVSKAHKLAKDAEKALEAERRQTIKREQRRMSVERKEQRSRDREVVSMRKNTERASRDATREERRQKKAEIRAQREQFAQEQKEAALRRAAELVQSNRVPIEITRGAAAAKAAASAALGGVPAPPAQPTGKKSRSSIVVSTASDLHQIVTHSKNLWAKYNAIAREHNQKVNWITVSRELGIHVKVREKYARMHFRAEQRNFDWEKNGHFKIKDYPHIFLEPTHAEQKAKMPPPPPDATNSVLIDGTKDVDVTDEAVAAAAAVVDAAVKADGSSDGMEADTATAAAVCATLVADPTAGYAEHHHITEHHEV